MTHMLDDALDPFLFKCHLVETRTIPLKQFMWKSGTERHLVVCSQTFAPTTSMNVSFWPIKTIVDFRTSAPCGRQVSLISAAWPCTDDKSSDGHGSFTVPPACCRAGKKETSSFEFRVPTPSKKKCDYLPKVHDPSGPLADQNPPQPDPIDMIYFFLKKGIATASSDAKISLSAWGKLIMPSGC